MNPVIEKVKNCTDHVLKKLENVSCKRRHSPENSNLKKPKISQRSRWGDPQIENINYIPNLNNFKCQNCEILEKKIFELTNLLSRHQDVIQDLQNKHFQSEDLRKILHLQIQEYRGPMKIFCRVKPSENKFIEYPDINLSSKMQAITITKGLVKNNYSFDKIFTEANVQEDIFKDLEPFIQTAVDGGKVCIFSYGQTGSGKTYTLEGTGYLKELSKDSGVLPRASIKIYSEIMRQNLSNLQVFISCIEVYLDTVSDLLLDSKIQGTKVLKDQFS